MGFFLAAPAARGHMSRDLILSAVMVAACVSFITIPLSGHISDRIGRRRMYLIGVVATGLFGFLYFGMVDTANPWAVFIAIVLSLIPHDIQYGPQAALIAESFTPRLRYSGASLGYQLASIIAGGPAPIIATALFATYHSGYPIAIFIAACAVISAIAAAFMPDYTGKEFRWNTMRSDAGRFRNRLRGIRDQQRAGTIGFSDINARVGGWIAHTKHADTWHLRHAIFQGGRFDPCQSP